MKSVQLPLIPPAPEKRRPNASPRILSVVPPPTGPAPAPIVRRRRAIWLALHFPDWPLRAALSALSAAERAILEAQPLAVVDGDRRSTVLACNVAATTFGIRAGHSLNAAIALSADVQFLPRNSAQEIQLLNEVAGQCQQYTSSVSPQPPNEIALEVRGSLRLFGGLNNFVERIRQDFHRRGFAPQLAMSPTVHSSLWLSRVAKEPTIVGPRDLIRSLSRLPVNALLWPSEVELRLARFGVLTIGDLLRLPRGGLARRIGYERLTELDAAVGRHPEVRRYFASAETYEDRVPLDFEIETTGLLGVILEKSLKRLQLFLTRRSLSVDCIRIALRHREQASTPVTLGLARPTADMQHVTELMREQLARVQLPSPVSALSITVQQLHPAPKATQELFGTAGSSEATAARADAQARLLEQLRSRLGQTSVSSLQSRADYRPERAHAPASTNMQPLTLREHLPESLAPRPLWLLSQPYDVRPAAHRTLRKQSLSAPERIESGWWDDDFCVRDYHRVTSPLGALGWVYRDRLHSGQWRLHGLFG